MASLLNRFGLTAIFSFRNQATATLGLAQAQVGTFQRRVDAATASTIAMEASFLGLQRTAILAFGGIVAAAVPTLLAFAAGKFEEEMTKVALVSTATAAQFRDLTDEALRLGIVTRFTPGEAAKGMFELASAGFSVNEVLGTTGSVLNFATASMLPLEEAAATVSGAMRAFGLEVSDAGRITDAFVSLNQKTLFHFDELRRAFGAVSGQANLTNQSLETTSVLLGALRSTGIPARLSALKLRFALRRLVTPQGIREFRKFNIDLVDQATGKNRNFIDILADMQKRTESLTDARKSSIFVQLLGAQAVDVASVASRFSFRVMREGREETLKGIEALKEFEKFIKRNIGVTDLFAKRMEATLQGQLRLFIGSVQTLSLELGRGLTPAFTTATNAAFRFTNVLIAFQKTVPTTTKFFLLTLGVFGALTVAFSLGRIAILALRFAWGPLLPFLARLIPRMAKFTGTTALMMNTTGALAVTMRRWIGLLGPAAAAFVTLEAAVNLTISAVNKFNMARQAQITTEADLFGKQAQQAKRFTRLLGTEAPGLAAPFGRTFGQITRAESPTDRLAILSKFVQTIQAGGAGRTGNAAVLQSLNFLLRLAEVKRPGFPVQLNISLDGKVVFSRFLELLEDERKRRGEADTKVENLRTRDLGFL